VKKIIRVAGLVASCIVIISVVFLASIIVVRALNRYNHRITTPNGIDEGVIVDIGGIKQYLNIRGQDKDNPIMVVLHGGPGNTLTPFVYAYQGALEKDLTVVNWDQRNAGKTYYLNNAQEVYDTLSIDRMVEDLKEIVEYLQARFGQENVIIMGHSWGSALGTVFVHKYPELVSAYIGVGQVVQSIEGDILANQKAREEAKKAQNQRDLQTFANLKGYLLTDPDFTLRAFVTGRKLVSKYLSPYPDHSIRLALFTPHYSLSDSLFFLKGSFELQQPLLRWLVDEFDVRDYGTDYKVPVCYVLGDSDWITPSVLAQEFFETISAPKKELVLISRSGHTPMLDNSQEFCEAVLSVLR